MHIGASPQPDEACAWGLASCADGQGLAERPRLGLKAVHNVSCSFTACSGRVAVARPSLQPEPVMTLPRTAAEVLSGHVTLEVRCTDRVLLTFRQPRLQYGQGIHGFFCYHRGNQFASSALMLPMTERFAADIRHYIDTRWLDLVRFAKGQSKDQVARSYLAGRSGGDQILFAAGQSMLAIVVRPSVMLVPRCTKRSRKSLRCSHEAWLMRSSTPASAG